jgi:predicted dehydrogenase
MRSADFLHPLNMNDLPVSQDGPNDLSRRDFVKNSSFAAAMLAMGGVPLVAQEKKPEAGQFDANAITSKQKVGVIGCGAWGRDIVGVLSRLPRAEIVALCDTYEPLANRAKQNAPKAEVVADYKKLLENKDLQSIVIATPTHQHKQIVLDALAAGKNVYCESPLAHTIEDARAIAKAAIDNPRSYFQAGQLLRSHPHHAFVMGFVRSGAAGTPVKARAQWHKKTSWRRSGSDADREKALNWRLDKEISLGLIGEIGIQQIDMMAWMLNKRPVAVTGFGSTVLWQDGRTTDDTAQVIYEFADGSTLNFEATLANSFDSDYEIFYGSDSAVLMRGNRAWMFKETDAPLLGWEVYARKEVFGNETGIALIANASKSTANDKGGLSVPHSEPPVYYAMEAFLENCELIGNSVKDFADSFDVNDKKALRESLAGVLGRKPAASAQDGFTATVVAIKGAEAVAKRERVKIEKSLFEI